MDETTRIDTSPARDRELATAPQRKERVNLALAAVAGALAVLVIFSASDLLGRYRQGAPAASPVPTATATPADDDEPQAPAQNPPKGKGRG